MTEQAGGHVAASAGDVEGSSVAAVDAVLAPLDDLDRTPLLEHAALFDGVHAGLHRLLAEPER